MVPWAFGSQTVGSVLRPAAYNGVVGLKPTFGRISRLGVIPMATSFDHVGVLVRSVADAALLLNALAGHDPDDPHSANVPVDDYVGAASADSAPPRLGLLRGWFFEEADAETRLVMEETAQVLAQAGAEIEEVSPGIDFARSYAAHRVMQESEMVVWHEPLYLGNEHLYGPKISVYLSNGFAHTARAYVAAADYRAEVQRLAARSLAGGRRAPDAYRLRPCACGQDADGRHAIPESVELHGLPQHIVAGRALRRRHAHRRAVGLWAVR